MKLHEIDWTDGKRYYDLYLGQRRRVWIVKDGSLSNVLGNITELYNLEIISQLNFEPFVDWSKVEVDTPILVSEGNEWFKMHFAKFEDGFVYVFADGRTSWTEGNCNPVPWKNAKLAESEEN